MSHASQEYDVVIVGAGNAALCAALAAYEAGAEDILVLERAPKGERGGNSSYTAGAFRTVYNGIDDIRKLVPDLSETLAATTDFGHYSESDYYNDMARLTRYRCDPDLVETLVENSLDTMTWMRHHGVQFHPMFSRQAFKTPDGGFRFWGGLTLEVNGGGPGLVDELCSRLEDCGVPIWYESRAIKLHRDGARVSGVEVVRAGRRTVVPSKSVILASGGFEANAEWRARYLGPGWDLAKVRGTRYNTGDGIAMALDAGAASSGHWSGCHAVAWELNAPEFGDLRVGDGFQKHSYPFGIVVNVHGRRFLDEGADFRNYTYAKYGHEILAQPGQMAWQVFDQRVTHLLRDEYRIREVTKVEANRIDELARKMADVHDFDQARFCETVAKFNEAVQANVPFDPTVKDGRGTDGLHLDKSNWANPLDTPPFEAYAVTCGVTFTFGGLRVSPATEVLDVEDTPIPGLYAAGELIGGLFYFNYPGGAGLMAGSVFGRIAGREAASADRMQIS